MRRLSALVILMSVLLGGSACASPGPTATAAPSSATPSPTASGSPGVTPSASPSATATLQGTTALVYFVVDTSRGPRLVREPRVVDQATPARGALEAMIAGPQDPDYASSWPKGTRILGISHRDGVITVDLSGEARDANVGAAFEGAMVDQLIWTVTGVLEPTASVMLNIEGRPAGEAWGHMVWDRPVKRGEPMDKRLLVGIDSLPEGATVSSPVTVGGEANVFEATLLWQVLNAAGQTVASGHTSTTEGQVFAPWQLTLTLTPGSYVLEVFETDPSGGLSDRGPDRDSRRFTVS